MIQVVIRVIPGGDTERAFEQAVAEVTRVRNIGVTSADYEVSAGENQNRMTGELDWSSRGCIFGHDRRQSVWALIDKVAVWAAAEALKAQHLRI